MGRLRVLWTLSTLAALLGACDSNSKSSDTSADDDSSSSKKKKKKKSDEADGDATETPDADITPLFGDASFGGALDDYSQVMFGAVGHSAIEPSNFSAGWVGRESYEVLKRARDGEFSKGQVRMADRRVCLWFKENNIVRRAMLATTTPGAPTEELAFAANGNLIMWYRHNRNPNDVAEDWAYFHNGRNLMLYQARRGNNPRSAYNASAELSPYILGGAAGCLQATRASNPLPGSAPAPVPVPAANPVTPAPGGGNASGSPTGLFYGALAYSESAASWRVSYRKASAEEARAEALGGCPQADCQIRTDTAQGQCLSVVHGPSPVVTWGWASDNNSAETNAIAECTKRGNAPETCSVKGTWCNDG